MEGELVLPGGETFKTLTLGEFGNISIMFPSSGNRLVFVPAGATCKIKEAPRG